MKGVSEIGGLQSIKSMHGSGKRSIPRVQSSAYLDLYMFRKEKDRLEKEIRTLDTRKKNIQKKLDEINKEMDKLQKVGEKEVAVKGSGQSSGKEWKKMALSY